MARVIRGANENQEKAEALRKQTNILRGISFIFLAIALYNYFRIFKGILSGFTYGMGAFPFETFFLYGILCTVCLTIYKIFKFWTNNVKNKYGVLASGLQGEDSLLKDLKRLDDHYLVMENFQMNVNGQRMEMDALVVSPYGVTLVECKNHGGNISGGKLDEEWTQMKTGRGGTPYSNKFRNPFKQMGRTSGIFRNILKECHMNQISVDTIAYFPSCNTMNTDTSQVCTNSNELLNTIRNKQKVIMSLDECQKLVKTILKHKIN